MDSSSVLLKVFEAKVGSTLSGLTVGVPISKRAGVVLNELRRLDMEENIAIYVDEIPEHVAGPRLEKILREYMLGGRSHRAEQTAFEVQVRAHDSTHLNPGSPQRVNLALKATEAFFGCSNVCGVASANGHVLLELTTNPNTDLVEAIRDFESANSCNITYSVVGDFIQSI